ncbi:hypothetical protein SDC9_77655 [bioreactor metagenome]|uniref:Uncharacterized protein n=1 Tax=bioreactor metagenome TaxID=1076179 RepID=A0A644YR75_9ZZZZ
MGAAADDPAVLEDQDLVGAGDGRHALTDDQHRPVRGLLRQGGAQPRVGGDVQGRERVVEDVQVGSADQRPGDREALALPAGHVGAALGDRGVEATGHLRDEVAGLGHLEGVPQLLVGGIGVAVAQVAGHRPGEQVRLLRHQPDPAPQQVRLEAADVDAVHLDGALGRVVQPRQQIDQGGLARSGGADDRGGAAGGHREADLLQHRRVRPGVGEADPGQGHGAVRTHLADRVGRRDDGAVGVEHLHDAIRADGRAGHHHQHHHGHHAAHQDLHQVLQERRQSADLDPSGLDLVGAEPQHRDARHVEDEHHHREHAGHQPPDAQRGPGEVGVRGGEPLGLVRFADEGADHPDAGDLLAQHPVEDVDPLLHRLEERHHPAHQQADTDAEHEHGDDDQPGHVPVAAQRHHHAADHGDRGTDDHDAGHQHQHLHLLDVVGVAGDQRRRAEPVHLARGERQHPGEDRRAYVTAEAHRHQAAEQHRADLAADLDQADAEHDGTVAPDVGGVALRHAVVDDRGVERGQEEGGDRRGELEHDDAEQVPPVRPEVAYEEPVEGMLHISPSGVP